VAQQARVAADWRGSHPANSLELTSTVGQLQGQGYRFSSERAAETPAMMVRLDGSDGDELWVGYHNFRVITRYNRSVMYALAVYQLSQEIRQRMAGETS
jgi:membrane-bound lytic murein transglycosylase B